MKRMILLILISVMAYNVFACSMFTKTQNGQTLVGNNEDWKDPQTIVWFVPAEEDRYGAAYVGFKNFFPQGGMNDQGLCFDGFATKQKPITASLDKPVYDGWLNTLVMETCSTIDEVIAVFDKYNLQSLETAMLMFVDKTGDAVIIEGDQYVRKEGDYQIVMNFYQSEVAEGITETCGRYNNVLSQIPDSEVSIDDFKTMLASVHQEGKYPTQYSNIFDPNTLKIYLYHFHNYENEVIIDVSEELSKEEHFYDIPALFPESFAYETFVWESERTFANKISKIIDNDGIASAWDQKDKLRDDQWIEYWYPLDEGEMNEMGYKYLIESKLEEAIAIFKMNVEFFPENWNCYDSLGEAYLEMEEIASALSNYQRSVELNPDNTHALEVIKQLKEIK